MSITDENLRKAYGYLIHNHKGYQESLERIHPGLVEYLIDKGIIGEGMNNEKRLRYHLTEYGCETIEAEYRRLTSKKVREKLDETKQEKNQQKGAEFGSFLHKQKNSSKNQNFSKNSLNN